MYLASGLHDDNMLLSSQKLSVIISDNKRSLTAIFLGQSG